MNDEQLRRRREFKELLANSSIGDEIEALKAEGRRILKGGGIDQPDPEGECKHEITRRWCGICSPKQSTQDSPLGMSDAELLDVLLSRKGWIASSFRGLCAGCQEPYDSGTPICVFRADGNGPGRPTWKAMCCANENDIHRPRR